MIVKLIFVNQNKKMIIAVVFLQDFHDTMLELERMKELNTKALLIQKVLRGYKYRFETKCSRHLAFVFSCELLLYLFMIHAF